MKTTRTTIPLILFTLITFVPCLEGLSSTTDPPRFVTRMKSTSVNKMDTVELDCIASGDVAIEISWSKEDRVIKEEKGRFLIRQTEDKERKLTSSKLIIVEADRSDGGLYQCNASNKWGRDYSLIQLIIKEIPDKPFHVRVVSVTGSSVNLTWEEPFNGNGMILKYVIKLTDPVSNETIAETSSLSTSTSISGLKPNTPLAVQVYALNEVGWSPPSNVAFFRTDEAAPSGPPLFISATATGPNSIKISWKAPAEEHWNGHISGFYVGYSPSGLTESQEYFKVIETSRRSTSDNGNGSNDRHEAQLTNLQRSTRYSVYVRAFNSKGKGPPSETVVVKTLDDVPPTAPSLTLKSSTTSSITISWTTINTASFSSSLSGVTQFILHYKRLTPNSEWIEVPITTKDMSYTIDNLDCGVSYEFYMIAHNSVGKSEPSAPLVTRTLGAPPGTPQQSQVFAKISPTQAVINLSAWKTAECLVNDFSLRIRQKGTVEREWLVLTPKGSISLTTSQSPSQSLSSPVPQLLNQVIPSSETSGSFSPVESFFYIRNLMSQTPYEVEVTAKCQGCQGVSHSQYEFYTKSFEPPRFVTRMKSQSINKKDSVELDCVASGDGPIEISWLKEDKVIKEEKDRFMIRITEDKDKKLTRSKLVIMKSDRSDGGLYQCNATNKWGRDHSLIQLTIKEIPDKPFHARVVSITGSGVNLTWEEPFNGNGIILKYVIKLTDPVSNETIAETSSLTTSSSISGLKPNTPLAVQVYAMNEVGWSSPSEVVFFRTDEAAPSGPPLFVSATATGPNSIKISWKAPAEELWNGHISGFYVGYFPLTPSGMTGSQEHFKVIETSKRSPSGNSNGAGNSNDRFEAHLTNLLRSTRYSAYVKAFNSKGKGPSSDAVVVKTLDDVPPTAPSLTLTSSSTSSITISWTSINSMGSSPLGASQFILYYKRLTSNSEWTEVPITSKDMSYTIDNLDCGVSYEFYMTAHNSVGKSEPSVPLVARTLGSPPATPQQSQVFAKISPTEVVINLSSWKTSECHVSDFTIRIRQKGTGGGEWVVLAPRGPQSLTTSQSSSQSSPSSPSSPSIYSPSSSQSSTPSFLSSQSLSSMSSTSQVSMTSGQGSTISSSSITSGSFSPTESFFFIRNLLPQTSYELEVTAKNAAGVSHSQFDFYTKSLDGVLKLKPDILSKYDPNHHLISPASSTLLTGLITPFLASLLIVVLILVIACILCSNKETSPSPSSVLYSLRNNVQRHQDSSPSEYLPNGGDGNVPFQAVSLKDLSSSLPPHLLESSRHTPLSIEVESSDSCLSRLPLSGSNTCPTYSRPYELFPVNITAVDTATLRRVQAAHAAANMDKNSTTTFQVRGGVYDF